MKVEILGTRGRIKPKAPGHSRHSGTLLDDIILLDLGEREYLDLHPKHIFITHLHADHAFFMEKEILKIDVEMFAPETSSKVPDMRRIKGPVELDGYRITPIPTIHSQEVRSTAYLIESDLRRILYTGDLVTIGRRYRDLIQDLDLVIADGSFIRLNGLVRRNPETNRLFGHTGIPNQVRLFSPMADRIIFSHFGSWFYKDIDESIKKIEAFSASAKVNAAFDGMKIDI